MHILLFSPSMLLNVMFQESMAIICGWSFFFLESMIMYTWKDQQHLFHLSILLSPQYAVYASARGYGTGVERNEWYLHKDCMQCLLRNGCKLSLCNFFPFLLEWQVHAKNERWSSHDLKMLRRECGEEMAVGIDACAHRLFRIRRWILVKVLRIAGMRNRDLNRTL